jgi:hypothetical protein
MPGAAPRPAPNRGQQTEAAFQKTLVPGQVMAHTALPPGVQQGPPGGPGRPPQSGGMKRTMLAPGGAPGGRQPSAAPGQGMGPQMPQSGPVMGAPGQGMGPQTGPLAPYGGMLNDGMQAPYPMPEMASPIETNAYQALVSQYQPAPRGMPIWLLVLIFAGAIGLGLGITILIASLT